MGIKEKLLGTRRRTLDVECPELGITVKIAALTGHDRDIYQTALFAASDKCKTEGDKALIGIQALLLSLSIVDDENAACMTPEDIGKLDSVAIDRLSTAALDLNAFTHQAKELLEKKV